MNRLARTLTYLVVAVVVVVGGGYLWASRMAAATLARSIDTHAVDFPIPWPVEDDGETVDARQAAIARGERLLEARYLCGDCHGEDFGGGVMMDAMPMAQAFGPNLTLGEGSATRDYTPADWDRAVRHGVGRDGRPLVMPAVEYRSMSDQELSDIVTYIRSLPSVDREVVGFRTGPVGKVLVATGAFGFSADLFTHFDDHRAEPPPEGATVEYGAHVAATCVGCHQVDYRGGKYPGEPGWPDAPDLTRAGVMANWSLEDFVRLMREGTRPDGTSVVDPMTFILAAGQAMSETELEAVYLFLQSLPGSEPAG